MERRIAVFANAWGEKRISDSLESIKKCAIEFDYDVFVFISHAAPGMSKNEQIEEKRIYNLPELEDFDGAIIFSDSMNFIELVCDIRDRANKAGIPIVNIGSQVDGMPYVGTSDLESMTDLAEHLVGEHQVKDIEFIAAPKDAECSNLRIEAVRSVFARYSIPFDEKCIHYGDWSVRDAMEITKRIIRDRRDNLPDAILCANDLLVISSCFKLQKAIIKVPEEVIVTGYDNLEDGQVFIPSLCTVGQDYPLLGEIAFEKLMKLINGEKVSDTVLNGELIKNGSCGCFNSNAVLLRERVCKSAFYDKVISREFSWSNNWFSNAILDGESNGKLKENTTAYLKRTTMFENGTTYILLDQNAKLYFAGEEYTTCTEGYSDTLDVFAAVEQRQIINCDTINRREYIPGYKKQDGVTKMYIFFPAHFVDWVFGYIVVEDWLVGIETGKLNIFVNNFNQTVEKLKQNISLEHLNEKLTDLYTKDSLTGIYNRFGFNNEGKRIFDESKHKKKHMVLMFIDVNRMKLINDYYGHLQGDIAIKVVAEVIKKCISKNWLPIRFGGDEFLVVGQCDKEEDIIESKERIVSGVKIAGKKMNLPFYLSVSCGYLYFCPEDEGTLDSYIKQVDESMYEIKAYMHASDTELREFEERCKKL